MPHTVMPHIENESERHSGQPKETQPPSRPNPDKESNSGYPAGGDMIQPGKDEYGRDAAQRRQAGLPPEEGQLPEAGAAKEHPAPATPAEDVMAREDEKREDEK